MAFIPVTSSVIKEVDYNAADRTLDLRFHNGSLHRHHMVTPEDYAALIAPGVSVGKHYNTVLRKLPHSKGESA